MASSDKQWWRSAKVLQWGGGVLVLAVCGALLLSASVVADTAIEAKADAAAQQAVPPLKVAVLGAERRDGYAVRRSFVGRVEAARSADVAFELSGRVMTLDADDGDTVTEGQVLATLDTARLQAQLTEAQARVSQADADRRLAAIRLERIEASAAVGSASTEELDEAEQRAASTEAAVLVARSAVDRVQVEIDLSTLVAPFDAVVARRSVDPGVVVQPGQAVFQLLDRRKPEARIGLAGPAAEQLAEGDQVTVSVRGRGGVVDVAADVARILPTRDARARTVEVVLVLDTELDGIRRGDLATLVLERRIEA
ncbi:MAG: efflux RND transporter periplasmic adaptor subunit, partial [Planctomycetota bacterium]